MKIVAVTACPSGVAHTYMAAEGLLMAAEKHNVEIQVETQGSIGIENQLTPEAIAEADVVILTNNIGIKHEDRFKGKPIVRLECSNCINRADQLISKLKEKLASKV